MHLLNARVSSWSLAPLTLPRSSSRLRLPPAASLTPSVLPSLWIQTVRWSALKKSWARRRSRIQRPRPRADRSRKQKRTIPSPHPAATSVVYVLAERPCFFFSYSFFFSFSLQYISSDLENWNTHGCYYLIITISSILCFSSCLAETT